MSREPVHEFEDQRPRLMAVAYRMLGSAAEAEDVVQDAFLRWDGTDRAVIRNPAAWLTKVVTNLCLTRLTSARARREHYVGPWLPEPVATGDAALGPLGSVEREDTVSMAFLLLLERLSPPERAVFVLREAFGYGHREIADLLDLSEANSQQLYRRARTAVAGDRVRFTASRADGERIARRFVAAARGGDIAALEALLAEEVSVWADGGGLTQAARRVIVGTDKVARYLAGSMTRADPGLRLRYLEVNGVPGIVAVLDGRVSLAVALEIVGSRIVAVRLVANPEKLTFLAAQVL